MWEKADIFFGVSIPIPMDGQLGMENLGGLLGSTGPRRAPFFFV